MLIPTHAVQWVQSPLSPGTQRIMVGLPGSSLPPCSESWPSPWYGGARHSVHHSGLESECPGRPGTLPLHLRPHQAPGTGLPWRRSYFPATSSGPACGSLGWWRVSGTGRVCRRGRGPVSIGGETCRPPADPPPASSPHRKPAAATGLASEQ